MAATAQLGDMPLEVMRMMLSELPFLDRMRLRLVSRGFYEAVSICPHVFEDIDLRVESHRIHITYTLDSGHVITYRPIQRDRCMLWINDGDVRRTYERRLRSSEAALHDFTALMSNQYLSIRNLHLHIRVPEGLYFLTKFVEALTEIQWKRGGQIGLEKLFLFADGFFPMVLTSVEAFQRDQLSVLEIQMGNLVEVSQLRALFGWETIERFIFTAGTIIELDNISIFGNVSQMTMNALLTTEDAIRFRDMFMRKPKFERFLVYLHRLSGIRFDSLGIRNGFSGASRRTTHSS